MSALPVQLDEFFLQPSTCVRSLLQFDVFTCNCDVAGMLVVIDTCNSHTQIYFSSVNSWMLRCHCSQQCFLNSWMLFVVCQHVDDDSCVCIFCQLMNADLYICVLSTHKCWQLCLFIIFHQLMDAVLYRWHMTAPSWLCLRRLREWHNLTSWPLSTSLACSHHTNCTIT